MGEVKRLRCDFHRLVRGDNDIKAFTRLLQQLSALPDDSSRVVDLPRRQPVKLDYVAKVGTIWLMDMVRIRMDVDPKRASKRGPVNHVTLEDHEGIAEETAMLFDPSLGILIIQSNRSGVSSRDIEGFFAAKSPDEAFSLVPLLTREGYLKLQKMREIRIIDVSIAGLTRGTIWKSQDLGVKAVSELYKRFEGPTVRFSVSMGRQPGSLSNAVDGAMAFLGLAKDEVEIESVKVSGYGEDDEKILPFNLLPYSMLEQIEVKFSGRAPSRDQRLSALSDALKGRLGELRQLISETP